MSQRLICADSHIDLGFLPRDLWEKRLPTQLRERGPKVVKRADGGDFWMCEGQTWGDWRGGDWWTRTENKRPINALDRGGVGKDHELRPTTPELRLADMDADGIEASVMFPPIFGLRVSDPQLAEGVISAYNDWAYEFSRSSPKRLISVAQAFPDSAELSTKELKRIAKLGMQQINFLVGTVTPEMYSQEWEPFWSAAEEHDIAVSYHVGGAGGFGTVLPSAPLLGTSQPAFGMGLEASRIFYYPFVSFFTSGLLERHPKLKIVLAESGTGWIPYVVQDMDYRFLRAVEQTKKGRDAFPLKALPSELFHKQVWATYQQDEVGIALSEFFSPGQLMWATDYPHPDSTFPTSMQIVDRETSRMPVAMREKFVRENAREFYGL